jgi:diketogulonate reductase-like aldo/keto reductase
VAECAEQGIAYVPFFPLGSAFQPFEAAGLETVAKRHEVSIHRVALAWLLQRPAAATRLTSPRPPLTDDDLAELNRS